MSATKLCEKDCLTPRGHGEGDGIRQNISSRKRVPISSATKFNARAPRDETLKLRLETALDEICGKKKAAQAKTTPKRHQKCVLKAASVAEITPTCSKIKKRLLTTTSADSSEIYATPRPFEDVPIFQKCPQQKTKCLVYRRLVLFAWRKARNNLQALNESLKKKEEQVGQLERQVDVLNKLRISEEQKRHQTQVECQELKNTIEILELENSQLSDETQNLRNTVEILQNEVKIAKAENDFLSDQTTRMQETINKKKAEKKILYEKVTLQEQEINAQNERMEYLELTLRDTEKKLQIAESNFRTKEKKYAQLKCDYKKQIDLNSSVSKQLKSIKDEKADISLKVENLELQLNQYIESCEVLKDVNHELTQEIQEISMELVEEKKQTWIKNTKQLALLSLTALQKIAYVVLPVYLDLPQKKYL